LGRFEITDNLKISGNYFKWLAISLFLIQCSAHSGENMEDVQPKDIITGAEQMDLFLPKLEGNRIALVVNHTSMVKDSHLVDTLLLSGINIVRVFSPEHGFRGDIDDGEAVESGVDKSTGIPISSLYGKTQKPFEEDLLDVDLVIFDIQDVGTRFYTYISTMNYVMEACGENGVPFMVLDRPNPNGDYIDGPVLNKGFESFVGLHAIPVVHGLTVGELAGMINGEGWLSDSTKCDLTVIPVANYNHSLTYEPPVKPSPNLPTYNAIRWYPTTCFFEGTVMSEGRGTQNPFELIGFTDPDMGEFSFTPVSIKGMSMYPKYKDETCWGIDLRNVVPERKINLQVVIDFYNKFKAKGEEGTFFKDYFNTLAGTDKLQKQIVSGLAEEEIRASWQAELEAYKKLRERYLLYPDSE